MHARHFSRAMPLFILLHKRKMSHKNRFQVCLTKNDLKLLQFMQNLPTRFAFNVAGIYNKTAIFQDCKKSLSNG